MSRTESTTRALRASAAGHPLVTTHVRIRRPTTRAHGGSCAEKQHAAARWARGVLGASVRTNAYLRIAVQRMTTPSSFCMFTTNLLPLTQYSLFSSLLLESPT